MSSKRTAFIVEHDFVSPLIWTYGSWADVRSWLHISLTESLYSRVHPPLNLMLGNQKVC
jgi:hypothetical protein